MQIRSRTRPESRSLFAVLLLRGVWIVQPFALGPLFADAASTLPGTGRSIAQIVSWAVWATVLLATFVPSTVSLTVGRIMSPGALAATIELAIVGETDVWKVVLGLSFSAVAFLVWVSGDVGLAFAQGSAYGDEERFPLRPPVPYLTPMVVSWIIVAGFALVGLTLVVNEQWVGVGLVAFAIAGSWYVGPRFHQFSRRWLVVVPAGVVIHDPLLLAENALFRSNVLAAMHLAPAGTEAADLTGGTAGVVIEVVVREVEMVVKAGGRENPRGDAIHVRSVLVSPTRPGRALAAAAARNLPVG